MKLKEGYKQTEAGVIPEDWEISEVGRTCSNVTTGRLDANAMDENGAYRFYTCAKDHYRIDTYAFDCEALLISGNGAHVGYIHYYAGKFNAYQRTYVLSGFTSAIKFVQHYLDENFRKRIQVEVKAGGTPYITRDTITESLIPLPPTKAEQEAIAEALSDADALIESQEQLIAKKRQIKQGAMQELLTGKKRLPGFSGVWEVTLLSEACWFQEGPGVRNYQFTTSGVKLFNGTNIEKGRIDLDKTNRFISEREAYGCYSHFLADAGDVVIACSGITVEKFDEKVAVLGEEHLPLCMNTSTMRFKVKPVKMNRDYLLQLLASSLFKQQIGGSATGSAQLNFGPSHVSKVSVPLPHPNEQTAIATILSDMDAEIAALETKLAKARQVKQGMMQKLLTGNIRLI